MRFINEENIHDFCFLNLDALQFPVRGLVMECHGLNDNTVHQKSPRLGAELGKDGILYLYPYYDLWAWCNNSAVALMNELLAVVDKMFSLTPATPFVICGGSMGGLTAIVFGRCSIRQPKAIACQCPVVDLQESFHRLRQHRRAIYSAYCTEGGTIEEAMHKHNPIALAKDLLRIPYLIISGGEDYCVTEEKQIGPFEAEMLRHGHDIRVLRVPEMGHCELELFEDAFQTYLRFIRKHMNGTFG